MFGAPHKVILIGLATLELATASVLVLREIIVFHVAGEVFNREFSPIRSARRVAAVATRVHRGDASEAPVLGASRRAR